MVNEDVTTNGGSSGIDREKANEYNDIRSSSKPVIVPAWIHTIAVGFPGSNPRTSIKTGVYEFSTTQGVEGSRKYRGLFGTEVSLGHSHGGLSGMEASGSAASPYQVVRSWILPMLRVGSWGSN